MYTPRSASPTSRLRLQQQPARTLDRGQQQSSSSVEFQSHQSSSGQMGDSHKTAGNEPLAYPRLSLVSGKSGGSSGGMQSS